MRHSWTRAAVTAICALLLSGLLIQAVPARAGSSTTAKSTSTTKKKRSAKSRARSKKRGQQKIDSGRAREIQEALIREHYLSGQSTGRWDDTTQAAMQKYQADNGWQTKVIPDSRALIKLGLGPDHEHLLNPQTAMTAQAPDANTASEPESSPSEPPARDH